MIASQPEIFGRDLFGEVVLQPRSGPVAERFTFPPFTVLDARAGDWQERKRAWISIGLRSEEGRQCAGNNAWNDLSTNPRAAESTAKIAGVGDGPTIFDPVLCELAYRWWCPEGGQVIDPFAGGSVRGIVAGTLGREYWGADLRAEQVAANEAQANELRTDPRPEWVCADSMDALPAAPDADFLFSCPPYGDLERYSDDPADLSTMEWETFRAAYRRIILRALARLKPDRFACFVVGDFRDPRTGHYRGFVADTIAAFQECGAPLYNDAVLISAVGSASMRVTKQFDAGRKLCKTDQNVLLFVKGDWRAAVRAL